MAGDSRASLDRRGRGRIEALLQVAAFATERILRAESPEGRIEETLERLGPAAAVSRVRIFDNDRSPDGELAASRGFEWAETPNPPDVGSSDRGPITYRAAGFGRWEEALGAGGAIYGRTPELPEPERAALGSEHVLAVAVVPIFAGDAWWGYLRLDDQRSGGEWLEDEITVLRIVADAIGAGVLRQESDLARREAEFTYRSLVEHIPMVSTYMDRVIADQPGHSIPIYISPQIEGILGYPLSDWLAEGELWLHVLHPDDAERMTREDEDARRHLRPLSAEYRMIARDGQIVWVSEKSAVVKDEETGTLYWQGVMVDITERKQIQEELTVARRKLLDQTVRASEEERRRIAADLHDGPVQRLAQLEYTLERARLRLERGDSSGPRELLGRVADGLSTEIQRLRTMMTELRPPILDHVGLGSALRDHADAVGRDFGLRCLVETSVADRLDPALETVLYRVAQEALSNVVRHAQADHAWLSLRSDNGAVVLEVRDNGVGFDPPDASTLAEQEHYGLIMMQERVEMAGGRMELTSTPGAGTTVRARIP